MSWREILDAGGTVLLDGGTGSELRRRGLELSALCWSAAVNLEHDDVLTAIHRDYIAAGADIVTANTFAASRFVLEAAGLDDRFDAVVGRAVRAACRAAAGARRKITVAASLSCLPPRFDVTAYPARDVEYRAYAELAERAAAHGAELILLEMLQDPTHAELACRAAAQSGLPWWIGLSARLDPAGTRRGTRRLVAFDDPSLSFERTLEAVLAHSPAAVAVMHTPLPAMLPAIDALASRWSGPIAAYAEIPYAEDPVAAAREPVAPAAYAEAASAWLARGASIIGGCCGTTPAHIAALRALADG